MPQSVQTQARRLRSLPLNAERSSCFSSSLFAQAIELIDRLADRLGQITEIEIGRDLVAYIRFGEPELRPLLCDVDRSLHVHAVFQCGVLQRLIDDVLADARVLDCN